jgi:hypothetical protein
MTSLRLKANRETATGALYATSHEHHDRIMPHVDALPGLAEMIDGAEREEFAARFEKECEFITGQLMPHIDAIEQTLYGELDRLLDARHSMEPMREEHAQLRRLFSSLCRYRASVLANDLDQASAIGLRRVLYRLYTLMKVHLAEEELYLGVIDREVSIEEKAVLARGIDHASAEPV